jgi:hypothetical protein
VRVGYTSPSGWIEALSRPDLEADSNLGVFHTRTDCERIKRSDQLRAVDRPWSARRCSLCATEAADPR